MYNLYIYRQFRWVKNFTYLPRLVAYLFFIVIIIIFLVC